MTVGWLPLSSRRVGPLQSIRVPVIEIFFQIEIIVVFSQDPGSITRINAVCILPGIVLFWKSIPLDLELETILEPLSVDILFHNPEILVIHFNRRWHWLLTLWYKFMFISTQSVIWFLIWFGDHLVWSLKPHPPTSYPIGSGSHQWYWQKLHLSTQVSIILTVNSNLLG